MQRQDGHRNLYLRQGKALHRIRPTVRVYSDLLDAQPLPKRQFAGDAGTIFGRSCFGQSTLLGVYRWLVLALIAYLFAFWTFHTCGENTLNWKQVSQLAFHNHSPIATQLGFRISVNPLPHKPLANCKI
jgi:hypothetical protein